MPPNKSPTAGARLEPEIVDQVLKAISQVRFGTITIVVQDGRVVQIDRTEKIRVC